MGNNQSMSGRGGGDGSSATSNTSTSRSSAEAAADSLQTGLASTVDDAQVAAIFPVQKASLQCTLRCFDTCKTPADLHACSAKCEAPVAAASAAFQAQLASFQQRLGRCAQGCQDAAQGRLGPDPSPSSVQAAQAAMAACVQGCAGSFKDELPTLKARLVGEAGKAAAAGRGG